MPQRPAAVGGLLLTGGASRRMGTDKALIEVGGQRLVDRTAAVLRAVADPVVEVGPGWSDLPAVREDPPGSGPLAALSAGAAALRAAGHDGPVLVLAVDMPRVSVELLQFLAGRAGTATAVPRAGGHPQPMCARYGPDVLAAVDERLAAGGRSLRDLLETLAASGSVSWVEREEWEPVAGPDAFADVDTPDDLRRLRDAPQGS
ncbi:MAG TPA: molybdenum cofactor guanylyltransferase [Acidimicrobiia bacterium]|jgi:molybdopterin-guanine dinucleotide biosynthesis protein A|nr:molybdenum cofactor guanylyltransferase [Acidimicrobiia bacterium]